MRTIAVGDIHGCRRALETVAELASFSAEDTIVPLGDYVDRGPDSRGVIDFLIELGQQMTVIPLRGNHEIMMQEVRPLAGSELRYWRNPAVGGDATLASYDTWNDLKAIPASHWAFIENCRPYYETDTHIFVHANLDPLVDLEDQADATLFWEPLIRPAPHQSGKTMVCGHTSQESGHPLNFGHAVCIDTYACGGGWLTALHVETGHYWQANEDGETRMDVLTPGEGR